jgi:hypothetical protein
VRQRTWIDDVRPALVIPDFLFDVVVDRGAHDDTSAPPRP